MDMAMVMKRISRLMRLADPARWVAALPVVLVFASMQPVSAQVFDFSPSVDLRLTYTDNARTASNDKRGAWVLEFLPGLGGGLSRDGGRSQFRFNAGLTGLGYDTDGGSRKPGLRLDAAGNLEVIEGLLFLNADAAIQRSNLTPFSGRPRGDFLENNRDNETRSFGLSPRLEFALGSFADTRIQYQSNWLSGGANARNSAHQQSLNTSLTSARMFGPLDWTLNHQISGSRFSGAADSFRSESTRASLRYAVTPLLRLRLVAGREYNDFGGGSTRRSGINGGGFDWNLSPRTSLSATIEDRFFGRGYDFNFSHRMARSSFQLAAGRDTGSSAQRFSSVYADPLFRLFFDNPALFRPDLTDPVERELVVKDLLGISSDPFVTNAQFVNRFARVGYTLSGVRNSISLGFSNSSRTSLSATQGLQVGDVFRSASRIDSREWSLSLDHRFTPRSGITATLSQSDLQSTGPTRESTRRQAFSLTYGTSLGHRTSAGITYRHQKVGGTGRFSENALSANMSMRF